MAEKNALHNTAILLPAFNEAKSLLTVLLELKKYSDNILLVDDGSTDETINMSYCQMWCMALGGFPVRFLLYFNSIFKFGVINHKRHQSKSSNFYPALLC